MKKLFFPAIAMVALAAGGAAYAQASSAPTSKAHHNMVTISMTRDQVAQMVQRHFAKLDADRDNVVTKAEADAAMQARHAKMQQRMKDRGGKMFERMDANKDGSVSREEMEAARAQRQQKAGAKTAQRGMRNMAGMRGHMFAMADANKDGRVTLQEATQMALQHFDAADANRDGTVSPDEMRAAHQKMRAGHAGH